MRGEAFGYNFSLAGTVCMAKGGDVRLIDADGSNDRLIADGRKYEDAYLIDSAGNTLIAYTTKNVLLHIDTEMGVVKEYPIAAHILALSQDGRYVLYLGMENESAVGKDLWTLDLVTGQSKFHGERPEQFIYFKILK